MGRIVSIICLAAAAVLPATPAHTAPLSTADHARHFENPYLTLKIFPGWSITPPDPRAADCCVLTITHGHYVLAIDPLFDHAGPIAGGRFSEILNDQPSIQAVRGDVDIPAGGFECSLTTETRVNRAITLAHLYTDPAKEKDNQYGCHFPTEHVPVWFASFFGGEGPQSDYKITLTYDSADINALPRKDSPELNQVLDEAVRMLRTLHLKPPIVIRKIIPSSAAPGATVTVYGTGFAIPGPRVSAIFTELPNSAQLNIHVTHDGKSLTFTVPSSISSMACEDGKVDINEGCVPTPPGYIYFNDCPFDRRGLCSVPLPPAMYHLSVVQRGTSLSSDALPFTVIAPPPTPVSLVLLVPAYSVHPGDLVTLRGGGFTPTGNAVHVGSVLIPDLRSTGGSIQFPVPYTDSAPFQKVPVFVSNANGESNILTLAYR